MRVQWPAPRKPWLASLPRFWANQRVIWRAITTKKPRAIKRWVLTGLVLLLPLQLGAGHCPTFPAGRATQWTLQADQVAKSRMSWAYCIARCRGKNTAGAVAPCRGRRSVCCCRRKVPPAAVTASCMISEKSCTHQCTTISEGEDGGQSTRAITERTARPKLTLACKMAASAGPVWLSGW